MFSPSGKSIVRDESAATLLAICHDDARGLCVRALRGCAPGAVLDRFSGEIGARVSQHSLQVRAGLHISATRYIGYLSHGCDPNCRLDMDAFELVALRPIVAGALLTIDYAATEDRLHMQFACACGADNCRGWITGRADPVNAEGLHHFAARDRSVAASA